MPQMELAGSMYEVDEKGFLQETEKWNEEIAKAYAALEGVTELTRRSLDGDPLLERLLPGERHLSDDQKADQGNGFRPEAAL